ncbi:major facilitator superfamily transporter [Phlyctema vagabunda]|uniref:Major facilitator superfamily transporter n=1 Tax=Phlyctema vagabunda TaxID=108571 RepID=A0ABR4P232_9HELO
MKRQREQESTTSPHSNSHVSPSMEDGPTRMPKVSRKIHAWWRTSLEENSQSLQSAVSKILSVLELPPLETFSKNAQASTEVHAGGYVGPEIRQSAGGARHLRTAGMAMTRENSQEPESGKINDALVSAPMGTLYEVTKLRNLRSNPNERLPMPQTSALEEDFISKNKISLSVAEDLFQVFNQSLNHYLWGGIALVHESLDSVRRSSSLLLAAILTVTALHIPGREQIFDICYAEFTALVCDSMLDRYHTLDGIRALCIGAFWLSDLSWKLSGHAVRIATELNLHQSYSRALRGSREHFEGTRLWYLLYVCDHHFSIAYGRPPVIHEDEAIVNHEKFLELPGTSQADFRLHSQVSLFIILTGIYNTFGPDVEKMLSEEDLTRLRHFNVALDTWRIKWESSLAPNTYISSYPSKGVILHLNFAKLQVNWLALRGIRQFSIQDLTTDRRELANTAISCAMSILQVVLDQPDIRKSVVGVPLYLHTMITYSAVFLIKVRQKWRAHKLGTDPTLIRDLVTRIVALLGDAKASERHLTCHIAVGLRKMLDQFIAWESHEAQAMTTTTGSRPIHPPTDTGTVSHVYEPETEPNGDYTALVETLLPCHIFSDCSIMAGIKEDVAYVESLPTKDDLSAEEIELQQALRDYVPDTEAEKKLLRKIDMHLIPTLWIMYILNYIDRTNIGNARIAGMADDLSLSDGDYSWVLSIFFFGYLICEVPSNMILSRTKPSLFLPAIMLVWGALSAAMACVKSKGDLLAFRFVLGCIESGFFPGVLFVMGCWYKTQEIGKRFAIFYSAAVLSGAFGGLLAGAITGDLDGAHGIAGWRWLFIVEGVATVGVAIIAKFILLDFPGTSAALTLEERQLATIRMLADSAATGSASKSDRLTHWQAFKAAIADPRTYIFMFLFTLDVGSGTISYFIPTITKSLGYTTVMAQYMTVPVYAVATVILNICAYSADHFNERRWHITAALCLGFVCALVCAIVQTPVVRYVMLCFVAAGIWSALPLIMAWATKTIDLPAEKRAISIAMINAVGNFSSVYGSYLWPTSTGPKFTLGWGVTAAFLGTGMVTAALIPVVLKIVPIPLTKAERALEEKRRQVAAHVDQAETHRSDAV